MAVSSSITPSLKTDGIVTFLMESPSSFYPKWHSPLLPSATSSPLDGGRGRVTATSRVCCASNLPVCRMHAYGLTFEPFQHPLTLKH